MWSTVAMGKPLNTSKNMSTSVVTRLVLLLVMKESEMKKIFIRQDVTF